MRREVNPGTFMVVVTKCDSSSSSGSNLHVTTKRCSIWLRSLNASKNVTHCMVYNTEIGRKCESQANNVCNFKATVDQLSARHAHHTSFEETLRWIEEIEFRARQIVNTGGHFNNNPTSPKHQYCVIHRCQLLSSVHPRAVPWRLSLPLVPGKCQKSF
jgi:thiamine pyrophosphate-dependent acetolactate synthase large subunit-like protein